MNKSFFYKDFKYWLKENRSRFSCRPFITRVRRDSFLVMFQECNRLVYLCADKTGNFSVWSQYSGDVVLEKMISLYGKKEIERYGAASHSSLNDWIADFDYLLKQDDQGNYFCELCKTEEGMGFYSIYKTRKEFLRHESYEPFLKWCNEKINPANHIVFFPHHTQIGKLEDILNKSKEEPFFIFKIKEKLP